MSQLYIGLYTNSGSMWPVSGGFFDIKIESEAHIKTLLLPCKQGWITLRQIHVIHFQSGYGAEVSICYSDSSFDR